MYDMSQCPLKEKNAGTREETPLSVDILNSMSRLLRLFPLCPAKTANGDNEYRQGTNCQMNE